MKKEAMPSKPPKKQQPLGRASGLRIGYRLLGVKGLTPQGEPTGKTEEQVHTG